MRRKSRNCFFAVASSLLYVLFAFAPFTQAQQTLGGITGTVMESTGSVLPGTVVTIVGDETTLTRSQTSNDNGSYDFVNLPIGTYTLTFTHEGFQTQKVPSIRGASQPHRDGEHDHASGPGGHHDHSCKKHP